MRHWSIIYLNPLSVNITVKQNPLVLVGLVVGHVPVSDTHQPFLPFTRRGMQIAIQLIACHSLLSYKGSQRDPSMLS